MKKFISDVKKELNDLLSEKEANREMKLIKRLADKKILLSFIIGMFLLVTIFVNLISNSIDGMFLMLAGGESKFNILFNLFMPNLGYPLLYLLAYGIMTLVLIKFIFNFSASFKDISEGQKGTSRFTTMEEIKEQYKSVYEVETEEEREQGGYSGKGGVIISRDKDILFIDDSPTNNMTIGTSRSGKGELFVFPTIDLYSRAEEKASLIVNDPKAELYGASKEILEARGYRVEVLNLINPLNSMSYNPLQLVIDAYEKKDYSTAQSLCKTLTHMLYYKPDTKDPFWQNSAMSLVNALILAVTEKCFDDCKIYYKKIDELKNSDNKSKSKLIINLEKEVEKIKAKITLYTVANMLSELGSKTDIKGNNELDKYFSKLPVESVAKMQYATSNFSKGEARGSIFSVAMSELNIFTMDEIAKLTSKNSIDLKNIGFKSEDNRPVALFMTVPDYDTSNHVIASIFVRQLYYVLAKEATFNIPAKCDREVIFLLDEFGNMPAIESMANIITVCLGRNIKFNLIIQGISQLKKLYGDDYKTILGNCSNKFYIFTNEVETAEEFSKLLGDKTITTYSRSGEILDTTKHQTESVDGRKLLTTDELMHLEEGEVVIVRGTKRRDINGKKIRPFPIFNTAEHTLKYRYEYLGDFFDNTKNLINKEIPTLHKSVDLKELILFKDDKEENTIQNKPITEEVEAINEYITKEKDIELGRIYTPKDLDNINREIEMRKKCVEVFYENSMWSNLYKVANEINNEKLNSYIKIGEEEIKNMK